MQNTASRRQVLAAAAATVTLPMLSSAIGGLRSAQAGAPAPATAPAGGWYTTTIKPADVKDGEFTEVKGKIILLTRTGKEIIALTAKCTHKGCTLKPKAGAKIMTCGCHQAQFKPDGSVNKGPAAEPLERYAIRVNAEKGVIEVDSGTKVKDGDANATVLVG